MTGILTFFTTLARMSFTSAVVILVICLLRLCLKRAPKKYSYWLWAAAAFRLVCPFSVSSVFSLFNMSSVSTIRQAGPVTEISYLPSVYSQLSQALEGAAPAGASPADSGFPWETLLWGVVLLWAAGAAAMLTAAAVSYARTRRRVQEAVRLYGNVFECGQLRSPFVLGFSRPRIYIPFGLEGNCRDYVLSHEAYHIKRRDYLVKPLAFLILTVHWMNPMVWVAFWLMSKDMELSCDEKVLSQLGEDARQDYSLSLLSFAENRRFPAPNPLAFGETGIKERVKNVMKYHPVKVWASVLAAVLCIAAVVICVTNPGGRGISVGIIGGADGPTQVYLSGDHKDQTFSSALLDAFSQTEEEAKSALGLTEDDLLPEKGEADLKGYGKKAVWFGREMDTQFWFWRGTPTHFLGEEERPDDQETRDFADTCFQQFVSQFGPPAKCEGSSGSYPYEDGMERELFQRFWETDSKDRLSFATRLTDGTYLTWGVSKEDGSSGKVTFHAAIQRRVSDLLGDEESASSSVARIVYEGDHISLSAQEVQAETDRRIELGAPEETAEAEAVDFLAWQCILARRAGEAGIDLSEEDYRRIAQENREQVTSASDYREIMRSLLQRAGMDDEEEYWESLPLNPAFQREVLGSKFLELLRADFDKLCQEQGLQTDWNVYLAEYRKNAVRDEHLRRVG